MQNKRNVQEAVQFVAKEIAHLPRPTMALVLGTGLGPAGAGIEELVVIPYEAIPGFPHSTVESHAGALSLGRLGGVPVWILKGRFHLYEGYTAEEVCRGVRTLAGLGVRTLLLTNAAGALNPQFAAGDLMLVTDHINYTGRNPLFGPNQEDWGPRFPDMSAVYSPRLREIARHTALDLGIGLERGVYIGVSGPNLETPAETRAFRILGADAIGMSTVLEVIAAHHMGLEIAAISCLTNVNLPDCMAPTSLEQVIAQAGKASASLARLLAGMVGSIARTPSGSATGKD
jgi:purine-nucleoside phosphorylase